MNPIGPTDFADSRAAIGFARKVSSAMKPSRKWQPLHLVPGTGIDPSSTVYQNHIYECSLLRHSEGWPLGGGPWARIGLHSLDGAPRHDWRDMQSIKNQLVGPDWEALELYPAESRLVDPSNYYILWCAPKIPIGIFEGRRILGPDGCIAPQRGWDGGTPI